MLFPGILFKDSVTGEIADETDQHWTFLLCLIKLPESWNLNCTWRCSVKTDSPASQVIESNWRFARGPNIWETSISLPHPQVYIHIKANISSLRGRFQIFPYSTFCWILTGCQNCVIDVAKENQGEGRRSWSLTAIIVCFLGHVFMLNGFFCGMQPLDYSPWAPGQVRLELRWVLSQEMRHPWAISILKLRQCLQGGFQSSFYLVLMWGGSYSYKIQGILKFTRL